MRVELRRDRITSVSVNQCVTRPSHFTERNCLAANMRYNNAVLCLVQGATKLFGEVVK